MRSLVGRTLLLLGAVVLVLGAAVAQWITAEDLKDARGEALARAREAEAKLEALARTLVEQSQEGTEILLERAESRLRRWLAAEPLDLHRDALPLEGDPLHRHAVNTRGLRDALTAEASSRGIATREHLEIVRDAVDAVAAAEIEEAARLLRDESAARAREATAARRQRLIARLGLLLLGMAALLAATLYVLVIRPVRRLRASVDRIASGDLQTPVAATGWPTDEMRALASDVERMRGQMRAATDHLEAEVERKTSSLAATLEERTVALEELRATRDRLIQVEKMAGLGTLAGGVAHEFNNLLGGILGCVENAREGSRDPDVLEDLDMARRTAQRATRLVDALLGVARPGDRAFAPVHLAAVVDDVLRAASASIRQQGVVVDLEQADDPVVDGDAGQLHQVVLNLVTNALQAVDEGERVVVALGREGRQAVFEVRDGGRGIPEADRARVFEPFFTGRAEGTGLGLFVSYGIVERHGGRIEVGEAPEGGARFTVRIPLATRRA